MAYTKMTVADFKKKLKDGEYETATGARRGIGKTAFSEEEKTACHRAIDKHFGEEAAPKKAGPTSGKKVAKAAAKPVKAIKAGAVEPVAAVVTEPTDGKKKAAVSKRGRRAAVATSVPTNDVEAMAKLHLAKERIGTITQAIDAMKKAKEAYPDLDTKEGAGAAGAALTDIMQGIHKTVKGEQLELDPVVMRALEETAPASRGLPGYASPVHMPNGDGDQQASAVS